MALPKGFAKFAAKVANPPAASGKKYGAKAVRGRKPKKD